MNTELPPFSRRRWLRYAAAGAVAALSPATWPLLRAAAPPSRDACATDGDFTRPLPVPGADGMYGRLAVGTQPLALRATATASGFAFEATAAGGSYVNPTLVVAAGTTVEIALSNALPEPTVVHWHGLAMDTRNDGNGESLVPPGGRFQYEFTVRNRAGLYWYHPHPHGATAGQVYRGLFGLIEVEDDDERALRRALDLAPGTTEIPLILQDRRPGDADRYAPAPEDELLGWYGCLPHVNGTLRPHLDVGARMYRLRVLNAANARTFRLAVRRDNGTPLPFTLIGTDGGLLERGIRCNEVFVSPAERVDLLVDFAGIAKGGFAVLETRRFDPMQAVPMVPAREPAAEPDAHGHGRSAPVGSVADGAPLDLLQFRIRDSATSGSRLPAQLSRLAPVPASAEDPRPLRLGFAKGRWRINDRVYDASATPVVVARDATETWLLRNYHASAPHAIHLHGYQFRVLERETSPDWLVPLAVDGRGRLATDLGAKDTVLVWPGESVRIAIDFHHPFPGSQVYLVHCHNLEHEDAGMMLRVRVG